MKTKYYISIAAAMLFTFVSLATQAQDVYEYATLVSYYKIHISYSSGKYEEKELEKNKPGMGTVLQVLAKMTEEGWEIVDTHSDNTGFNWKFFLKRKVKQ